MPSPTIVDMMSRTNAVAKKHWTKKAKAERVGTKEFAPPGGRRTSISNELIEEPATAVAEGTEARPKKKSRLYEKSRDRMED